MKRFVCTVAFCLSCLLPTVAIAVPKIGQPAPQLTLPGVDGKMLSLAALQGRAVYINFFATWCPPCNDEAPFIAALSARYRTRGLTVIGVDELENSRKGKEFIDKYRLPYTVVVDSDGKAGRDYGALGLPVHIFITRAGRVSTYRLGQMSRDEVDSAIKSIL